MKVKDLIERLQKMNPDAKVTIFDGDTEQPEEVSGMVFDNDEIYLQSDDIS